MKDHFINLFKYDRYANGLILDLLQKVPADDQIIRTMAHLLGAQKVWWARCSGNLDQEPAIWPDWQMDSFAQKLEQNHANWLDYINSLDTDDFDKAITYRTSTGNQFENKLRDIMTHVINHGTHHRAQIGQYIKQQGENLPLTDYILYLRTIV